MNKLALLLLAVQLTACSSISDPYFKVGAGYKLSETQIEYMTNGVKRIGDHPLSARFEVGAECIYKNVTCGVTHRSQWLTGAPFNNQREYGVTELFVDYTFELGD